MRVPPIIQSNIPLAPFTSFKAGGNARYFVSPRSHEELAEALYWSRVAAVPVFILGKGTNLVFSDEGYPGLVINTAPHLSRIHWNGPSAVCAAGALAYTAVAQSVKRGLAGIQKLGGIPGTLGGAAYMNAGAYGQEFCETIDKVTSLTRDGEKKVRSNAQCGFTYRHSTFWDLDEIIVEVALKLQPGDKKKLEEDMRRSLADRKNKQPLHLPNSGSVFKRPEGQFPGEIVEKAGFKGRRVGGAEVSPKHANFIINSEGATAQDLYDLSEEIRQDVQQRFGILLEREVFLVGNFLPWPR